MFRAKPRRALTAGHAPGGWAARLLWRHLLKGNSLSKIIREVDHGIRVVAGVQVGSRSA